MTGVQTCALPISEADDHYLEAGFAGQAVHGCIVLVEGIANPAVSRRASEAEAVGQLHISPHQYVHEMCISPVWGNPTHETVADLPSTVVVTVPLNAGTRIKAMQAANAELAVTLTAEVGRASCRERVFRVV